MDWSKFIKWEERLMVPLQYSRISEFTATVLGMWVVYGSLVFAAGFHDTWSPAASLARLPTILEFVIGLFIAVGGSLTLYGALPHHPLESDRWQFEITGLTFGGFGWLAAGVAALFLNPAQPLAYVVGAAMATAAFWRAARVWGVAKHTRETSVLFRSKD